MKLFKRLAAVLLAGVLAVGMLTGCSGGGSSETPNEAREKETYRQITKACNYYNYKVPEYSEELSAVAAKFAEADAKSNYTEKNKLLKELQAREDVEYATYSAGSYTVPKEDSYKAMSSEVQNNVFIKGCNTVGIAVIETTDKYNKVVVEKCVVYAKIIEPASEPQG